MLITSIFIYISMYILIGSYWSSFLSSSTLVSSRPVKEVKRFTPLKDTSQTSTSTSTRASSMQIMQSINKNQSSSTTATNASTTTNVLHNSKIGVDNYSNTSKIDMLSSAVHSNINNKTNGSIKNEDIKNISPLLATPTTKRTTNSNIYNSNNSSNIDGNKIATINSNNNHNHNQNSISKVGDIVGKEGDNNNHNLIGYSSSTSMSMSDYKLRQKLSLLGTTDDILTLNSSLDESEIIDHYVVDDDDGDDNSYDDDDGNDVIDEHNKERSRKSYNGGMKL